RSPAFGDLQNFSVSSCLGGEVPHRHEIAFAQMFYGSNSSGRMNQRTGRKTGIGFGAQIRILVLFPLGALLGTAGQLVQFGASFEGSFAQLGFSCAELSQFKLVLAVLLHITLEW